MTDTMTARDRLLDLIRLVDAMNQGTTPDQAVDDAIQEALLNQPSLRTCLVPGCLRQYDAISYMNGDLAPRPEWSGKGWATLGSGTIFPAGGHICPDHKQTVTDHLPRRVKLPNDRWTVDCACGWMPAPQSWHGLLRALWEQHLLTVTGALPAAPPVPDPDVPGTRVPLAEHTEDTLTELYDRLWDAEADHQELRDLARSCILNYTAAVPALLGVKTSLEALRTRITLDSRDWTADKVDALLYAILVGANCEDTTEGHVHNGATRVRWQSIEGPPPARYSDAWTELTGYVQEAVNDGGQIAPEHLAAYMRELRHKALAPAREWIARQINTGSRP